MFGRHLGDIDRVEERKGREREGKGSEEGGEQRRRNGNRRKTAERRGFTNRTYLPYFPHLLRS